MTVMAGNPAFIYACLFLVGALVSFINSISGGGSVLSLPLLMLFGLPSAEANGTNRLGILLGTVGSVTGFWRKGHFYPQLTRQVGVPGLIGSLAGSWVGVSLPDALFKPVLAAVILFVVIETARPKRKQDGNGEGVSEPYLRSGFWPFLAYAGIGFYGGFIQAGVGFVMMYVFSRLGNLNLIQTNVLKVSDTFIFMTLSLLIYGAMGKVKWDMAVVLALGNALGGYTGSTLQLRKGEGFVRAFLVVTGMALAAKLIFDAIHAIF